MPTIVALGKTVKFLIWGKLCDLTRSTALVSDACLILNPTKGGTGRALLIRSHSSARFCFELSGNSN